MRKLLMIALNTVALLGMASMAFAANQLDSASLGYTPSVMVPVSPIWPPLSASASPLSVAVSVWVWA